MCKINEIMSYKGINYKRIGKSKLDSLILANGLALCTETPKPVDVFVIQNKANISSPWIDFFHGIVTNYKELEKWLNEVSYYNCNNELGNYLHYYIIA